LKAACCGVQCIEQRGHLLQSEIRHGPNGPQRVILPHAPFWRKIAEHIALLMIYASHQQL